MTRLTELLLPGAEALVERYRTAYDEEHSRVMAMIRDVRDDHTSLPNNYWHKCHELRGKYILAIQLRESLKELLDEKETTKKYSNSC